MKAFEFDSHIIESYERFSRSFSTIRAKDLDEEIKRQYENKRFWPDALLSLNPRFRSGPTVDHLVGDGTLDGATGKIFQLPGPLYQHQAESIAKAGGGKSYVVTTGTGSGKSLCFFIPIVDAIVRARKAHQPRRTRAIIVYPMNALANSQINEIEKFIAQSGLPETLKPVVRRYTGQESQEERQRIVKESPDILLTNFMMAELLLIRQDELDTKVINHAQGLEFIVLDEFHTYRGRQGADVAILVRRLRNRCTPDKTPICIGTSATMANEGASANRAKVVADVAARLFGTSMGPDAVIDESLQRTTDDRLTLQHIQPKLAEAVRAELPDRLTDENLRTHPLAVWVELAIGLDDQQELKRKEPIPLDKAAGQLAKDSGQNPEICRRRLEQFLTMVSLPETERGGTGSSAFLAFKLSLGQERSTQPSWCPHDGFCSMASLKIRRCRDIVCTQPASAEAVAMKPMLSPVRQGTVRIHFYPGISMTPQLTTRTKVISPGISCQRAKKGIPNTYSQASLKHSRKTGAKTTKAANGFAPVGRVMFLSN